MKISALSVIVLAVPAMADWLAAYQAVSDDTSVAVCGKDLYGCAGKAFGHRRCGYARAAFAPGGSQSIGSRAQTWVHDEGMLQNRADNGCLGVVKSWYDSSSTLDSASDYAVRLLPSCNKEDLLQRWLLGDDDRMHSIANYDLCLTIQSDVKGVLLEDQKGAPIILAPCTADDDELAHRQRLQMIGASDAFVFPTQSEYGLEDMITLAFWTNNQEGEDRSANTLEVFAAPPLNDGSSAATMKSINQDDSTPLYTQAISTNANIIEIDAQDLLATLPNDDSENTVPTRFVARLGSVESAPFVVNPQEEHVAYSCNGGTWLAIIIGAFAGLALMVTGVAFIRRRRRSAALPSTSTSSSGAVVVSKGVVSGGALDDDEVTQASSDEEASQVSHEMN